MKIGILAPHNSGKTYLIESLYDFLSEQQPLPVVVIKNVADYFNKKDTLEIQGKILEKQINEEWNSRFSGNCHIICDQMLLGHYAYYLYLNKISNDKNKTTYYTPEWVIKNIEKEVSNWTFGYEYIFRLDPREASEDSVVCVDKIIDELVYRFDLKRASAVNYHHLTNENRHRWLDIIKVHLGFTMGSI